jgi:hypothetical protein
MNHKEINDYREDLRSRIVRIETIVERSEKELCKINSRTSSLEGWRSWMTGGMAILVILITIAIGVM